MKTKTKKVKSNLLDEPTRNAYFPGQTLKAVVEYAAQARVAERLSRGAPERDPQKDRAASSIIRTRGLGRYVARSATAIYEGELKSRAEIKEKAALELTTGSLRADENFSSARSEPESFNAPTGEKIITGCGDNTITRSKNWRGATVFDLINYVAEVTAGCNQDYDFEKYVEAENLIEFYKLDENVEARIAELKETGESETIATAEKLSFFSERGQGFEQDGLNPSNEKARPMCKCPNGHATEQEAINCVKPKNDDEFLRECSKDEIIKALFEIECEKQNINPEGFLLLFQLEFVKICKEREHKKHGR